MQSVVRLTVLGLTIFLAGCYETETIAPAPLPAMVENTKRAYLTKTFTQITSVEGTFRDAFEDNFGELTRENYQVEPGTSVDDIIDHYARAFETWEGWQELGTELVNVGDFVNWKGWQNEDDLFLIFSVNPGNETEFIPVFTLGTLKTQN